MSLFTEHIEDGLRLRGAVHCDRFPAYQFRIEGTALGTLHCSVHRDRFVVFIVNGNRTMNLPYYMPGLPDAHDALTRFDRLLSLATDSVV